MIPDFVKVGLFGQVRPVGEVVWKSEIIWISYFLQLLRFIELEIAKNIQIIPNIEFKMPNHELWKRNVNKLINCLSSQSTWLRGFHRKGVDRSRATADLFAVSPVFLFWFEIEPKFPSAHNDDNM